MHLKFVKKASGYSRIDLLVAIVAVALLGTVGLSVLGSSAVRNDSVVCANNLRQIGRAYHMWASDHVGENPFWTHYNDGGSFFRHGEPQPPGGVYNIPGTRPLPAGLRNNPFLHFAFIHQELRTPATLVCPTDRTRKRAQDFSYDSAQGFFAAGFQNRAVSYFVGVHAMGQFPNTMLSGDRSLKEDTFDQACSANVGLASFIQLDGSPPGWNSDLHPSGGNVLLNDGRVEELSDAGLATYMSVRDGDNGSTHILKPF